MGSIFDMFEGPSQPLRHEPSQPLRPGSRDAHLPSQPLRITNDYVAATATQEPTLTNKEYLEFLRDYYSTPPDLSTSQPLRTVAATAIKRFKYSCKQCGWYWESWNLDPKRCASCGSHKWR